MKQIFSRFKAIFRIIFYKDFILINMKRYINKDGQAARDVNMIIRTDDDAEGDTLTIYAAWLTSQNITPQMLNYKSLIGHAVKVEISCHDYGFNYPANNVLVEITKSEFVFQSNEIESENKLWRFDYTNQTCSCKLSLADDDTYFISDSL